MHTYFRICPYFHHTIKCEHLPKLRVARAALSIHSPKELDTPKPTTRKWKQKISSSTTDHFQASTSRTKSSVGSHTIYSVGIVVPCTICTGHNHEPEACPLMEKFRHICTRHNFHLPKSGHPNKGSSLALTQAPITKIIPPPNVDDTIHHIRFISSYIQTRTLATHTSWVPNLVPVIKNQGTLCFCIDFREIQNLHGAIELLDDTQPL